MWLVVRTTGSFRVDRAMCDTTRVFPLGTLSGRNSTVGYWTLGLQAGCLDRPTAPGKAAYAEVGCPDVANFTGSTIGSVSRRTGRLIASKVNGTIASRSASLAAGRSSIRGDNQKLRTIVTGR